jgi:aquaporin Z
MLPLWKQHWPEYLMEAGALGLFMLSACFFTALLMHPASPVVQVISDPTLQRALIGAAMGLTLVAIVYSPWGKQSGAHLNPAFTLTFLRLGKVAPQDAAFYIGAQFAGGILGVQIAALAFRSIVAHPTVHYVATMPGMGGAGIAFLAETGITFLQMSVVLRVSNTPCLARFTGIIAGCLVAAYITLEAPLSGMSMNPARTFGSALAAQDWTALWVYFTAPLVGMLLAAEIYSRLYGKAAVACAKMHHQNAKRCIFCAYHQTANPSEVVVQEQKPIEMSA